MRKEKAPPCPKCGSTNTVWNGAFRILCGNCGRSPRTVSLPKELPDYSKRPRCPRCGARHANKHGVQWYCGVCGKTWPKKIEEVLNENN